MVCSVQETSPGSRAATRDTDWRMEGAAFVRKEKSTVGSGELCRKERLEVCRYKVIIIGMTVSLAGMDNKKAKRIIPSSPIQRPKGSSRWRMQSKTPGNSLIKSQVNPTEAVVAMTALLMAGMV